MAGCRWPPGLRAHLALSTRAAQREGAGVFCGVGAVLPGGWELRAPGRAGRTQGQGRRASVTLSCSPCRDLSNNQIAEIAPDAFQGLRSLNSL